MRDSDGGEEGVLGGRYIRRIVLEQDLATDAVQEGISSMFSRLIRERQSFVDPSQRSCHTPPFGFELSEQTFVERQE